MLAKCGKLMKRLILIMILVMVLGSCYRPCSFYDDLEHVITQPTKEELAGNYKPDEKSIRMIRRLGFDINDLGQVIVKETGEFILVNAPKLFLDKWGPERISANGIWQLYFDERANTSHIIVEYDAVGQLKGFVNELRLYRRNDKLILFRFLGDPDECQCLIYERQ